MSNDATFLDKAVEISHFVGLSGIGGVQRIFFEYIEMEIMNRNEYMHTIYTAGEVDLQYKSLKKTLNILKFKNFLSLALDVISRKRVVHFYNNLTSPKVALFLLLLPTSKLIVHERGSAWNLPLKYGFILKFISWKADLILANSKATKNLLEKKFGISENKIKVIYNGINTAVNCKKLLKNKTSNDIFLVGFIGRLDTPKGVHILIDAMQHLKSRNIKLIIAGNGPLEKELKRQATGLINIEFLGRIDNPYKFFGSIDLLVVPSIREPFGNICIEAGLCKVPVLAAYVDGISEIIENNISGELIKPTHPVLHSSVNNSLPLPEYVVDPVNFKLIKPMQIDSFELADKILLLSNSPKILSKYANALHRNVINNFSIEHYAVKLNNIYTAL